MDITTVITSFFTSVLISGATSAIITGVFNRKNAEKERIFLVKQEGYINFINTCKSYITPYAKGGKDWRVKNLEEVIKKQCEEAELNIMFEQMKVSLVGSDRVIVAVDNYLEDCLNGRIAGEEFINSVKQTMRQDLFPTSSKNLLNRIK